MKIILKDGTEVDTSKLRDYPAFQYETFAEFLRIFVENKIYFWTFTLDAEGKCCQFFNLPEKEEREKRALFIASMSNSISKATGGHWELRPVE